MEYIQLWRESRRASGARLGAIRDLCGLRLGACVRRVQAGFGRLADVAVGNPGAAQASVPALTQAGQIRVAEKRDRPTFGLMLHLDDGDMG